MIDASTAAERRTELAERQAFVAQLLAAVPADQLLILETANLSWFAGVPLSHGILDPTDQPALVVSPTNRWVVCSNVDSGRLFNTFLDDLGFQLKEWPWQVGRDQLLADLCDKKRVCCDRLVRDATMVADQLKSQRLVHSSRTQQLLRALGRDLAHALEATGRAADVGVQELELAGQLAHRLMHRGVEPITMHVAADGRDATDFRPTPTSRPVQHRCLLSATGSRDGLYVAASRTILFDEDQEVAIREWEVAGQIVAARQGTLKAGETPATIFNAGQRVATALQHEHDWRNHPFGTWTGWLPIETTMSPTGNEFLQDGHLITLASRIGSADCLDTYLVHSNGAERITCDGDGAIRRFRIAGQIIELPDVLRR